MHCVAKYKYTVCSYIQDKILLVMYKTKKKHNFCMSQCKEMIVWSWSSCAQKVQDLVSN